MHRKIHLPDLLRTQSHRKKLEGSKTLVPRQTRGTLSFTAGQVGRGTGATRTGQESNEETGLHFTLLFPAEVRTCEEMYLSKTYKKEKEWPLLEV